MTIAEYNRTIISPSTKMLPMDEIADSLEIIYNFQTTDSNAKDTDLVSNTPAELIAKAATDSNGNLIEDRETVQNALHFDGRPIEDFLTSFQAASLEDFTRNIAELYTNEIAELRTELYLLKSELTKNGFVKNTPFFKGFQDTFSNENKLFNDTIITLRRDPDSLPTNTIHLNDINLVDIGDKLIVKTFSGAIEDNNIMYTPIEVVEIDNNNNFITIDKTISDISQDKTVLLKTLGEYSSHCFSFSTVKKNAITGNEKLTMLNDDTFTKNLVINSPKQGYAVAFYIPEMSEGALATLSISAKCTGSPGALRCYVIEEKDILNFKNYSHAINNNMIKATSNSILAINEGSSQLIDFNFDSDINGDILFLKKKQKYCFIIEAQQATEQDYWEIKFCTHNNAGVDSDLQSNNQSYAYKEVPTSEVGTSKIANTLISNYDMYFILKTREVLSISEEPYVVGLYTTNKHRFAKPVEASSANLVLEINREGKFIVNSPSGIYGDFSTFSIVKDPNAGDYDGASTGISTSDIVVIGDNLRSTTLSNSRQLTLQEGMFLTQGDLVYRVGYDVSLKAKLFKWNKDLGIFMTSETKTIPLTLTNVISDGIGRSKETSDKLLFTGSFFDEDDNPYYINEYELQIAWHSNFDLELLKINKDLIGKIHNLTLAFDKDSNKKRTSHNYVTL